MSDDSIERLVKHNKFVSAADEKLITEIATSLIVADNVLLVGDVQRNSRWAAIKAIEQFRQSTLLPQFTALANDLPVRQAVIKEPAESRFYWRGEKPDGEIIDLTNELGEVGSSKRARKAAALRMLHGETIVAIVPPDRDVAAERESDQQRNRSKSQPDGMTVTQRTKRH